MHPCLLEGGTQIRYKFNIIILEIFLSYSVNLLAFEVWAEAGT